MTLQCSFASISFLITSNIKSLKCFKNMNFFDVKISHACHMIKAQKYKFVFTWWNAFN